MSVGMTVKSIPHDIAQQRRGGQISQVPVSPISSQLPRRLLAASSEQRTRIVIITWW